MKKTLLFLVLIFAMSLVSCAKKNTEVPVEEAPVVQKDHGPKIDYDLSGMNYNMLSSITFDMLIDPEKYTDKTIKMSGQFYSEVHEGKRYFSVIVWDATRCCPAGMDFIPPASLKYPEDFPEQEQTITVTGKLKLNQDDSIDFDAQTMEF